MVKFVLFFFLVVFQAMSFTFISRARNRNHAGLAMIASLFSNTAWILVFREIVMNVQVFWIYPTYIVAMALGTLIQMKLSMKIEARLKTKSDAWHMENLKPEFAKYINEHFWELVGEDDENSSD